MKLSHIYLAAQQDCSIVCYKKSLPTLAGVSETGAQSFTGEISTTSRVTLLGAPVHCTASPVHSALTKALYPC